jgi:hypothetical protein
VRNDRLASPLAGFHRYGKPRHILEARHEAPMLYASAAVAESTPPAARRTPHGVKGRR